MVQHFHHGLVLVSLLVAIVASYTALNLALRIREAPPLASRLWLAGGGIAMGVGIWAMHFVGMLALVLPIEIAYNVATTLLSLLIAVVVSGFALHMASRELMGRGTVAAAGVAMGIGICSMHYVGMAAIEITPPIRYDPAWVAASFGIAVAASFAALWLVFAARAPSGTPTLFTILGAIIMGCAIAGMHYAGMAAAQFPVGGVSEANAVVNKGWLAGSVTMITLFVLAGTLLLSFVNGRSAQMEASLLEARQSSRAKDEFLAMLGHELRNPLASISNAVFLLGRARPESQDWRFSQDVIARQTAHLAKMVDDLLDVGRAITGKMSLTLAPFDLCGAVESALRAVRAAGRTGERSMTFDGRSAWVRADRTRIEQVVTNLVGNALQHTQPGGHIRLRVAPDGGESVLTVADDGAGMDAVTAAKAFELFYQGEQSSDRGKGGLGVGLTLARRIVEMHAGRIGVESAGRGKGTTVTVRLPAVKPTREERAEAERIAGARPRRVLLVEDADDARVSLEKILRGEGHQVETASDGVAGLRALVEHRPEVALIDIGLPGMDGYELVRRARAAGVDAYLVALTGYGQRDDKDSAEAAGFDLHITKPPAMEMLLELVATVPSSRRVLA